MIAIGCDHGGFDLKQEVIAHLKERGIAYKDLGVDKKESVDYPDYAKKVCTDIQTGESDLGILICGTGVGISIAANKHKGIRAALAHDCFSAEATKLHNNANVLCMGGRIIGVELALRIVDIFIQTPFSEEARHIRRVEKLED